ncbi:MAG: hypothetical protein WCA00_00175 [Candidatus Acidiferrales bacterium]
MRQRQVRRYRTYRTMLKKALEFRRSFAVALSDPKRFRTIVNLETISTHAQTERCDAAAPCLEAPTSPIANLDAVHRQW